MPASVKIDVIKFFEKYQLDNILKTKKNLMLKLSRKKSKQHKKAFFINVYKNFCWLEVYPRIVNYPV
jgi:uncharacterized HAD superfamily protein